jgi:hypothetical protein
MLEYKKTIITISVVLALTLLSVWYAYLTKTQKKPDAVSQFQSYTPRDSVASPTNTPDGFGEPAKNNTIKPTGNEPTAEQPKKDIEPVALTGDPVGGGAFAETEGTVKTLFVDRAKGTIYEVDQNTNKATKISNITIPGIVDFAVDTLGTTMLLKTSTSPNSHELILTTPSTSTKGGSAQKITLDTNVIDAVIGNAVYYLNKDTLRGGSTLYRTDSKGENKKSLWHSSLTDWILKQPSEDTLEIQQKASNGVPGYSFLFSIKDKKLTPLLSDIAGLETLVSPKKNFVLYTSSNKGVIITKIKRLSTGKEVTLASPTFPEKCAWAKDESFVVCGFPEIPKSKLLPDEWYQGSVTLIDKIQEIDPLSGNLTEIKRKKGISEIDVQKISLATTKKQMLIVDKKTGILWTLSL